MKIELKLMKNYNYLKFFSETSYYKCYNFNGINQLIKRRDVYGKSA